MVFKVAEMKRSEALNGVMKVFSFCHQTFSKWAHFLKLGDQKACHRAVDIKCIHFYQNIQVSGCVFVNITSDVLIVKPNQLPSEELVSNDYWAVKSIAACFSRVGIGVITFNYVGLKMTSLEVTIYHL